MLSRGNYNRRIDEKETAEQETLQVLLSLVLGGEGIDAMFQTHFEGRRKGGGNRFLSPHWATPAFGKKEAAMHTEAPACKVEHGTGSEKKLWDGRQDREKKTT